MELTVTFRYLPFLKVGGSYTSRPLSVLLTLPSVLLPF